MRTQHTRSLDDVLRTIRLYHERAVSIVRHRYRSWEHCFHYFQSLDNNSSEDARRTAALHLAFFLASWGMYRGSSFLLQRDFTVHERIVEQLLSRNCARLRSCEIGTNASDAAINDDILAAVHSVREGYAPFGAATDTLITKVLLGTTACLPACDRYFVAGYKAAGFAFSRVNARFIGDALDLCAHPAFRDAQKDLREASGFHYPLMKLVDMYYWQKGYELDG